MQRHHRPFENALVVLAVLLCLRGGPERGALCQDQAMTKRPARPSTGTVCERRAKETLTAVEMNHGDTLKFTLRNGQVRTMVLEDTSARIVERVNPGGIVYEFACGSTASR